MTSTRFLSSIANLRTRKLSLSLNPPFPKCLSLFILPCLLLCVGLSASAQQPTPAFTQIIVFGDSLSDTGNVRDRTGSATGGLVDYPSNTFNYSDGRWTNSSDTDPA